MNEAQRHAPPRRLHGRGFHRGEGGIRKVILESAIDGVPTVYRSVFLLREAEGLATPEVAECLEISEEAVRTRLHRARALLRRHIYESTGATSGSAFAFHLSRCDRVVTGVLGQLGLPWTARVH